MNTRERNLALGLGTIVGGWILWSLAQSWIIAPMRARDQELLALQGDVERKRVELYAAQRSALELSQWRQISLPADESVAQTLYLEQLRSMLADAGIERASLRPSQPVKRAGVFSRIPVSIDARSGLDQLTKFLKACEASPYLHQIRRLRVQPFLKDDKIDAFDLSLNIEVASMEDAFAKESLPTADNAKAAFGQSATLPDHHFGVFVAKNVFQPTQIVAAATASTETREGRSATDERGDYYLTATLFVDGIWEVWLTKQSDHTRKVVREGEKLGVGGMDAEVVRIQPDAVVLRVGDSSGILPIGKNLESWKGDPSDNSQTPLSSTENGS